MSLHSDLLGWYSKHKRDLPWRRTKDPYAIWVSEVMLQQTQVATVVPYYRHWMERFPTIESLASAAEEEILAMWQGLGYYRRCRHLRQGAQYVVEHRLPSNAREWLKVPGVGRYTAGAIASIAQGHQAALVDGNVERVYARLKCDRSSSGGLSTRAWSWAEENISVEAPGEWNQALMELGATVCKPVEPSCESCPIQRYCAAYKLDLQNEIPSKKMKPSTHSLIHSVVVPVVNGRYGVRKIGPGKWWAGMYEFPREEGAGDPSLARHGWLETIGSFKHSVTNHRITVFAYLLRLETSIPDLDWFTDEELVDIPMPAPQRRVLELARKHLPQSISKDRNLTSVESASSQSRS